MSLSDPLMQTLTLVVPLILIFYLLIWRPQQQRAKQMKDMMEKVSRGDTVVTAGGIVGRVAKPPKQDDPEITVEIADNVQVRVLKSTLLEVRPKNAPANDSKSDKS
jgi:preprotein translocase subunit YajC